MPDILSIVVQSAFEFLRQVSPDEDYCSKSELPEYMLKPRHGSVFTVEWRAYSRSMHTHNELFYEVYAEVIYSPVLTEII